MDPKGYFEYSRGTLGVLYRVLKASSVEYYAILSGPKRRLRGTRRVLRRARARCRRGVDAVPTRCRRSSHGVPAGYQRVLEGPFGIG
jgi:hypothetical protein